MRPSMTFYKFECQDLSDELFEAEFLLKKVNKLILAKNCKLKLPKAEFNFLPPKSFLQEIVIGDRVKIKDLMQDNQ